MKSVLCAIRVCLVIILSSLTVFAGGPEIRGVDDLGRTVVLPKPPERIIVLTGTPIDAIFELGAGDKIVGVVDSMADSYPDTVKKYPELLKKERVGRFDNPYIEKIMELNPDLIIPYASLDTPGKYTAIFDQRGLPYAGFSTVENFRFGLDQILRLGVLLGKKSEAEVLVERLRSEVDGLSATIASNIKTRPLVYYWWGQDNGTYGRKAAVHELIGLAGGVNLAGDFDRKYMELSPEYVISRNPDVIIVSYWKERDREPRLRELVAKPGFRELNAVKNDRIYSIDGHSFHTPIRFAEVIRKLAGFIHPELMDGGVFAKENNKKTSD